jgi:catalase
MRITNCVRKRFSNEQRWKRSPKYTARFWLPEVPGYKNPALDLFGAEDSRDFREDDFDCYTRPGKLFRLMNKAQSQVLFENTARAMGDAPEFIKTRHIGNCLKANPAYGKAVADTLDILLDKIF